MRELGGQDTDFYLGKQAWQVLLLPVLHVRPRAVFIYIYIYVCLLSKTNKYLMPWSARRRHLIKNANRTLVNVAWSGGGEQEREQTLTS